MSKAILVMDMPLWCSNCRFSKHITEDKRRCDALEMTTRQIDGNGKPDWCPLIPAIGYVEPVGNMVSWEDEE